MNSTRRPTVVINPASRRGQEWATSIEDAIGKRSKAIYICKDQGEFAWRVKQAVELGEELWVGGGDGTIRQAAKQVVSSQVVLGILPLGTGNALANELGIPADPIKMIDFLFTEATPRTIDVGQLNDEVFVNVATFGLTSGIAEALKTMNKGKLGRAAYLPAVVKAAYMTRSVKADIEIDGTHEEARLLQFVACSSRLHGGPFAVTESSSNHDGLLSVYMVRSCERYSLLKYGASLLAGRHTNQPHVWAAELESVVVRTKRPTTYVLDGDFIETNEAHIRILPGALNVLADPKEFEKVGNLVQTIQQAIKP